MNSELYFGVFGFLLGVLFGFLIYAGIIFYTSPPGIPKHPNPPNPPVPEINKSKRGGCYKNCGNTIASKGGRNRPSICLNCGSSIVKPEFSKIRKNETTRP